MLQKFVGRSARNENQTKKGINSLFWHVPYQDIVSRSFLPANLKRKQQKTVLKNWSQHYQEEII
jgi:hypothetical protein